MIVVDMNALSSPAASHMIGTRASGVTKYVTPYNSPNTGVCTIASRSAIDGILQAHHDGQEFTGTYQCLPKNATGNKALDTTNRNTIDCLLQLHQLDT